MNWGVTDEAEWRLKYDVTVIEWAVQRAVISLDTHFYLQWSEEGVRKSISVSEFQQEFCKKKLYFLYFSAIAKDQVCTLMNQRRTMYQLHWNDSAEVAWRICFCFNQKSEFVRFVWLYWFVWTPFSLEMGLVDKQISEVVGNVDTNSFPVYGRTGWSDISLRDERRTWFMASSERNSEGNLHIMCHRDWGTLTTFVSLSARIMCK